jgi:hypothetical protein
MKRRTGVIIAGLFAVTAFIVGCGLQLRPLGGAAVDTEALAASSKKAVSTGESQVVFRFFDEQFVSGGYEYTYPDESKVFIPENSGKNGEVSLQFDLVANDYSGGSVCLYNMMYDINPYIATGALQFWVKGNLGSEIAWAALVDDENGDGKKTVLRLPINNYGGITKDWTLVSIPLVDFGKRGVFWDAKKRVEVPEPFQWDKVCEFRIEIKKNENPAFRIWVDDIFIASNVFQPKEMENTDYWDDRDETLDDIPVAQKPAVKETDKVLAKGDPVGFAYVYGGKTAFKVQKTKNGAPVFANYMDGSEYSGVTISLGEGKYANLTAARTAKAAGIAFWGRGAPGVGNVGIGLLDNQGKNAAGVEVKVQTKVLLGDFNKIGQEWVYYMVPIRSFRDEGLYWDDSKNAEVSGKVNWAKVQEVRFSVGKGENKVAEGEPVTFYVSDLAFIEDIPGYVNPEDFWNAFKSNAPEVKLHDFEKEDEQKWESSKGPKSEVEFKYSASGAPNGGAKSLEITYRLGDWVDVLFNYRDQNRPAEQRDWTKHWGLKFDFYTDKPYQPITVQVQDKGNEIFVAPSGGNRGWTEVIVPFKNFSKFPYYQPDDAQQNGTFDLDGVIVLDFKPAGEGSRGTYKVDNIRLTNDRVAKVKEDPAKVAVTVTGSDKEVTKKINEGLFGINVALWDGDLLLPATEKFVKDVNHHVLRYPGGLRADEDHWEEVLKKKDWMVDIDEFLDFCRKTNTTPMITVNFGTGTPEEAARWVNHVNKVRKANVKYWEIGNELYGDWHNNHCTPEEYGKRAREFAKQMKAVDPSIVVTAVWMLEGEWNRKTFEQLKDVVDGVNVHHYPQGSGQENDAGLLAAPQTLNEILPGVRKQLEQSGVAGKKYEIWLTEWNSVDFKPGPQTLGIVNALFVADYLGMLTHHNIEQASYWDVHNNMTPEGGDYGYLSRVGAPDGDNAPRPSYWAFKMASRSLGRGSLLESATGNDRVSSYYTRDGKKKSLMLVNKHPRSAVDATVNIPGFQGKAVKQLLNAENAKKGPTEEAIDVKPGMKLSMPAHSVVTITVSE